MKNSLIKISIILCSYNEAQNLPVVIDTIHKNLDDLGYILEIIVVNDGSTDNTKEILDNLCHTNQSLFYISFSRNFGHQKALKAGIDHATGNCIISMDADMQHPPHILPQMIDKWKEGYEIVYTRRAEDTSLPKLKKATSKMFYKTINRLSDIKLENGVADFRLIDCKVANYIKCVSGYELFMRGYIDWIGFSQYAIDYVPEKRLHGSTKYSFKKMLKLATSGILLFSTKPLEIALYVGLIISFLAFIFLIPYSLISYYSGYTISGWASLISIVGILGGLILFVLGIIGLYIGRIYKNVRGFPPYIISETNMKPQTKQKNYDFA